MKLLFAALLLSLVTIVICDLTPEQEDDLFNDYLKKYNVRLGRSDNVGRRKRNFIQRYNLVEEHNKRYREGKESYQLAINEFASMSYDEFVTQWTGLTPGNSSEGEIPASQDRRRGGRAAPASFDWRTVKGVVRPVQNQGGCGSCWAFGGVGTLEGQLTLKKGRNEKISEQEVIECARSPYDGALRGCNGGWGWLVYNHARDRGGVTTGDLRPYRATTSAGCNLSNPRVPGSKATGSFYRLRAGDENQMKDYLYSVGPLYMTYYVSSDFFSYQSGVYRDSRRYCGTSNNNNHGVLLVGYGAEDGVNYWLVKNSWGPTWGEAGYFKIERGRNLCGVAKEVHYPYLA